MKVNQIKIGVILSYVSMLLTNVISLLYTPYMLSKLGQNEYGLYTLSASTISYLGLLSFGFGSAYMRYYARYKAHNDEVGINRLNGMFMSIFIGVACLVIIGGIILVCNVKYIFSGSLTSAELVKIRIIMAIMVVNLAITFPSSVFSSFVTAHERFLFQRVLSMVVSVGTPVTMIIILLSGYKSIAMSIVTTGWTILQLISRYYYCHNKLNMKFDFSKLEWSLLKEMGIFSFFIFLNSLIDTINWGIDKFLLGIYKGTVAVAIYGVASTFNSYFLTFSTSVSGVFIPRVNDLVAKAGDDADKMLTDLLSRVGRIQFMILALILSGFVFFGKPFIVLFWGGPKYKDAYYMAIILMATVMIPLCQNVGIEIQRAKNKHQFRSVVYTIIAVVNFGLSIPMCKLWGGIGCAIGTGISLVVGNIIIMNWFYHVKLGLNMKHYWINICKIVPSLIIPVVLGTLIMKCIDFNSIIVLMCFILLYSVVYVISVWFIGMNSYEKLLFTKPLNRVRNMIRKV